MSIIPSKLPFLWLLAAPLAVPLFGHSAQAPLGVEAVVSPAVELQKEEPKEEEDAPPVDKRDEVKELLKTLKAQGGKRGAMDKELLGTVETLMTEFKVSGPKDKASIVKGVGGVFKLKRKLDKEGRLDPNIYMSCAIALGEMGPESAPELVKLIGNKQHRSNIALQARVVRSLGKTKNPVGVKPLLDLLGYKDYAVEQAAAEALGQYTDLSLKKRKEIFNEVLKSLMSAKNAKDGDINNESPELAKRYNTVSAPMIGTLESMSGNKENTPEEWQTWWNKNKKKDWDKEEA